MYVRATILCYFDMYKLHNLIQGSGHVTGYYALVALCCDRFDGRDKGAAPRWYDFCDCVIIL
jgi:hypothetical protein